MSRLEKLQRVAFWVAVVSATLGFLTSAGCTFGPDIPEKGMNLLYPVLVVFGTLVGYWSVFRGNEIDRERWRIAEDPSLTSGERDYAHKYAERQRRLATTSFIAAPLMLGYWMAYQVEGEGEKLLAQLLPVAALVGAVAGMLIARLRIRTDEDSGSPH